MHRRECTSSGASKEHVHHATHGQQHREDKEEEWFRINRGEVDTENMGSRNIEAIVSPADPRRREDQVIGEQCQT